MWGASDTSGILQVAAQAAPGLQGVPLAVAGRPQDLDVEAGGAHGLDGLRAADQGRAAAVLPMRERDDVDFHLALSGGARPQRRRRRQQRLQAGGAWLQRRQQQRQASGSEPEALHQALHQGLRPLHAISRQGLPALRKQRAEARRQHVGAGRCALAQRAAAAAQCEQVLPSPRRRLRLPQQPAPHLGAGAGAGLGAASRGERLQPATGLQNDNGTAHTDCRSAHLCICAVPLCLAVQPASLGPTAQVRQPSGQRSRQRRRRRWRIGEGRRRR
mmetsp:Transcript_12432/g.43891  ORF Transcript_12432/g.43891 Transcript_12432/m.43891 type:complete len:273 (+) Transcript_12432:985-1803(+)